jgi:chorismate synthase
MNSFGRIFRITIFGESHGSGLGVVIDGCPAGLDLEEADLAADLDRRRAGQEGTTARREPDRPRIMNGVWRGRTTGAPVTIAFENTDVRPDDYSRFGDQPRPGHVDFAAGVKYGRFQDPRGGGHFSGRMTLALVSAGVVAKKLLAPIEVKAALLEAGGSSGIRQAVETAEQEGDSIGGIVECRAEKIPAGLGEPFFDSAESLLSHLVFSVPGIRGIEFGSGFACARMKGSQANDPIIDGRGTTASNHAGGVNGGITNGNALLFRVAVRPPSSIHKLQQSFNFATGGVEDLAVAGRHDACIALRVPPAIEACAAVVLADLLLLEQRIPRRRES